MVMLIQYIGMLIGAIFLEDNLATSIKFYKFCTNWSLNFTPRNLLAKFYPDIRLGTFTAKFFVIVKAWRKPVSVIQGTS